VNKIYSSFEKIRKNIIPSHKIEKINFLLLFKKVDIKNY